MKNNPESNFESDQEKVKNAEQELREMIKDSVFGEHYSHWIRISPKDELAFLDRNNPDPFLDRYIKTMLDDEDEGVEILPKFLDALLPYKDILNEAEVYPIFYIDLFGEWLRSEDVLKDEEVISAFITNHTLRMREKIEDIPERLKKRLMEKPLADEEEINAGIYREELESQVADAVFELRDKGYGTFQSGFRDLPTGSQFIDFEKDCEDDLEELLKVPEVVDMFSKEKIVPLLKKGKDRLTLTLKPKKATKSLRDWKKVWDLVAEKASDRGSRAKPPTRLGSYGRFVEKQEKMRRGERVYIGHGLEFDGTKVIDHEAN